MKQTQDIELYEGKNNAVTIEDVCDVATCELSFELNGVVITATMTNGEGVVTIGAIPTGMTAVPYFLTDEENVTIGSGNAVLIQVEDYGCAPMPDVDAKIATHNTDPLAHDMTNKVSVAINTHDADITAHGGAEAKLASMKIALSVFPAELPEGQSVTSLRTAFNMLLNAVRNAVALFVMYASLGCLPVYGEPVRFGNLIESDMVETNGATALEVTNIVQNFDYALVDDPPWLTNESTGQVSQVAFKLTTPDMSRYIDGTGCVWYVYSVTNTTMANWKVTTLSDVKGGAGTVIIPAGAVETFYDPMAVPPLANGVYAVQNAVRGDYRWSIYNAGSPNYLTVWIQNIPLSTAQYLSKGATPLTYTNVICNAWAGGLSSGQCLVTYTPITWTVSVVTSSLPRVAFVDDFVKQGCVTNKQLAVTFGSAIIDNNLKVKTINNQPIVPRAWMPLTTQGAYGFVDLNCASNSMVLLGPAPLNSFVIRPLITTAYLGTPYLFSNIVFYCDRAITDPRTSQGFTAVTTGVFTVSAWGLSSPKGYVMRRTDSTMSYGSARRNIAAYSLGILGTSVRLICVWSPATDEELADADAIIDYENDAR